MMEAGRELDSTIALEIMGWQITHRGHRVLTGEDYSRGVFEIGGMTSKADALRWMATACPHYSTDWGAMRLVVEKLKSDRWDIHIDSVGFNNDIEGQWRTFFSLDDADDNQVAHVYADGDTMPEAVALAALAAVGASPVPSQEEAK